MAELIPKTPVLVHVPPATEEVQQAVSPTQIVVGPVMVPALGQTAIEIVEEVAVGPKPTHADVMLNSWAR